jgi:hypothetical protein
MHYNKNNIEKQHFAPVRAANWPDRTISAREFPSLSSTIL